MPLTKITVMIHEQLFQAFNKQVNALHLKRDAFLSAMIDREIPYLAAEMEGKRLSPAARRHVSSELKRLGTRKVNLQIDKSTSEELNKVVARSNMVRDAFINRVILYLRSTNSVLDRLQLPYAHSNSFGYKEWLDPLPISPMGAMEAVHADPFFYVRFHVEKQYESGLYLLSLPPKLIGFSCYLSDAFVPGTEEYKQFHEDLLGDIFASKDQSSAGTSTTGGAS